MPLFYEELDEKVRYIAEKLKKLKAANDLLDKVERAILERLELDKNAIQRIESGAGFITDIELKVFAKVLDVS